MQDLSINEKELEMSMAQTVEPDEGQDDKGPSEQQSKEA